MIATILPYERIHCRVDLPVDPAQQRIGERLMRFGIFDHWGDLSRQEACRSLELFASEAMPAVP